MKPKTKYCWECGRKFWGNKFIIANENTQFPVETHIECKKLAEAEFVYCKQKPTGKG